MCSVPDSFNWPGRVLCLSEKHGHGCLMPINWSGLASIVVRLFVSVLKFLPFVVVLHTYTVQASRAGLGHAWGTRVGTGTG